MSGMGYSGDVGDQELMSTLDWHPGLVPPHPKTTVGPTSEQ